MAKKYSYNEKRREWSTKVWDGTYNPDGSKHRKHISSKKSSKDLENRVNEFMEAVRTGGASSYSDQTFTEYAYRWLEVYKAAKEKRTQGMYKHIIDKYFAFLSDVRISDIRHSHFQQCINANMSHPKTCKNIYSTFSQIIRTAVREHILPKSALDEILEDISLPKYIKPEKRPLSAVEREAFLKAELDGKKAAFLNIIYYCGLRRGEALALTADDFDWDNKRLSVRNVLIFINNTSEVKPYPKSDRGIRKVPMPDALITKIRPFVEASGGFLFRNRDGRLITDTGYRRMWDSIITSLNIAAGYNPNAKKDKGEKPIKDLTAHIFRHNYCTELCYQVPRISTKMIARLMGDDEKMILEVYGHIVEEKENVADTLNDAFNI